MPQKTAEGKWVIYRAKDGLEREHWPIDARPMLASGEFVAEPPEGVKPKEQKAPPRNVEVPRAAGVETPEAGKGALAKQAATDAAEGKGPDAGKGKEK